MAQTTGGFSATDAKIQYAPDGTTWTDISGFANSIKPGPGTRQTGARWTHEGDIAILTAGKRGTIDVEVSVIYTEGTGDPFEVLRARFEAVGGSAVYLRWSPKGGTAGEFQYATSAGVLKKFDYPATDAEDAKPAVISFTVECVSITKSVATT